MAAEPEETCPNFGFQTSPSRRTEIKVVMRLPSRRFQAAATALRLQRVDEPGCRELADAVERERYRNDLIAPGQASSSNAKHLPPRHSRGLPLMLEVDQTMLMDMSHMN
jgi:hypothetical protein